MLEKSTWNVPNRGRKKVKSCHLEMQMYFTRVYYLVFLLGLCPWGFSTTISPTPKGQCYLFFLFQTWIRSTKSVSYMLQKHQIFCKDTEHSGWVSGDDRSVLVDTSNHACFENGKMWSVHEVEGKSWPDMKDGVKLHTKPPTLLLSPTSPCSCYISKLKKSCFYLRGECCKEARRTDERNAPAQIAVLYCSSKGLLNISSSSISFQNITWNNQCRRILFED